MLAAPVCLLALVYLLLWLPPIQQKIKDAALREVMKKTHDKLSIGGLYLRPFNRLQLKDVYAGDLRGDTLFYAADVSAEFNLFRLLRKQLSIGSVSLDNFVINVQKDSLNGDYNFQFLIDAFASSSPDTVASSMTFQMRDVRLKKGRVAYNVRSEPVLPDSLFDINHIRLSQLYSEIDVRSLDTERLDIRIHSLSFKEKSGLDLRDLQAKMQSEGEKYLLSNARLRLPHSQFTLDGYYDSKDFYLTWDDTKIRLPDLKMFYPALSAFPDDWTLAGEIRGTGSQIALSRFRADYGKRLRWQMQGTMADYRRWQESPLEVRIEPFSIDSATIDQLICLLSDNPEQAVSFHPGNLALSGRLQGSLPYLKINLKADGDCGGLRLEGSGGYDFRIRETRFDALLAFEQLNVGGLLQDTLYGLAAGQLQAKGTIPASGAMNINAGARIDRFDFNGYSYNRIYANAAYWGDSIRLNVSCDDSNLPLEIDASADVGKKRPGLTLDANLGTVCLDTLRLLPDYPKAFLSGRLRADVRGVDPENMRADICIDSLSLTTAKGSFHEPQFSLFYAATGQSKNLTVSSQIVNVRAKGNFTYAGLQASVQEHFPLLFSKAPSPPKKKEQVSETLDFRVGMNHVSSLSDLLELPRQIPDSALFLGKYTNDGLNMKLSASAYTRFMETDTLQLSLSLSNQAGRLAAIFNVDNKSANYDVDGSIDAEITFIPKQNGFPDMDVRFLPTVFVLNETIFDFNPSTMEIRDGQYLFHNLLLDYAEDTDEYIRIDGAISSSEADSLTLDISQFQLSTLFGAVKTDVPLSGIVNGRVTARNLLSEPLVQVKDFAINRIGFDDNAVGDLKVNCGWNHKNKGLALNATLGRDGRTPSVVTGFIFPDKDSLSVQASIRDVELQWFQKRMAESLYGLSGSIGADVQISGKISDPAINGVLRANHAQAGIRLLNTLYSMNDSIFVRPGVIELKNFTVFDENRHTLTASGTVTHNRFSGFTPKINLTLNDFLALNNEHQTDSLFYGNLRVNGLLTVKQGNKEWLISGDVTHSDNARFTVNLPSTASTAERYDNMVVYTNVPEEIGPGVRKIKPEEAPESFSLPLKIDASLWFDPSLTIGAVFNPVTGDAAYVKGNGMVKFAYDMKTSNMSLLGNYEILSGSAGLSLVNITKKTFTVQEGGKLVFRGDPMETTFNLTALYNLRADLIGLDPSFGNIGIVNTKAPVTCSLTAVGSIDRMTLEYDILLPSESDDIQRKVDGLLYTDDMKIKQIAYLVALGSFMPASSDSPNLGSPNLVNSLTSLTSGGLNKLLSNVLSDKWSIGTDVTGLDNISINVSGAMLNDRLTVNGTVGYHNNTGLTNNFTGDFNIEYKLAPSGNLILKAYNVTNNQYYEQAPTTQGVGVAYKREARTFRKLFDKFKKKK